ncbi:hypothetical protein LCGC14_0993410 [marine sediment metagenome]|uniref:Uncharacterized protein n=1 Tax=marine sediment metagenome TaxID=412755 RepID=A0A0F9NRI8_9ZZZZ
MTWTLIEAQASRDEAVNLYVGGADANSPPLSVVTWTNFDLVNDGHEFYNMGFDMLMLWNEDNSNAQMVIEAQQEIGGFPHQDITFLVTAETTHPTLVFFTPFRKIIFDGADPTDSPMHIRVSVSNPGDFIAGNLKIAVLRIMPSV